MTRYGSDAAPELSLKTFPEERFESTSQEESRSESEFHDNNRNSVNCNRSRFLVAQSIFRRKSKRDIKGNSDISRRCNKKISINRKIILFPFLGFYKYCKKGKTHRPDCNTEKIEISDISLKSIAINHARSTNSLTSSESVSSGSENFTSTALSFKSKLCSSVSLESRNTSHAFNLEEVEEVNEIEEEVNEIEEEVDSNTTISSNNASFTSHDNSTSNISSEEKIIKSGCSALDVLSSQTEISRRCAQSQSCLITSKEDALKSYTNSITEEAICAIVVTKSGPLFNAKISDTRCNTLLANPNICIDDKNEKESSRDGCDHTENERESSRDGCDHIEFSRCDTLPAMPNVYIDDKNEKESSRVSCDHIDFSSSDYPFDIFGTNANDTSVCPHVLFPSLLNKLRAFFPYVISEDNLWLKYSLVRDVSSILFYSYLGIKKLTKHWWFKILGIINIYPFI